MNVTSSIVKCVFLIIRPRALSKQEQSKGFALRQCPIPIMTILAVRPPADFGPACVEFHIVGKEDLSQRADGQHRITRKVTVGILD